MNKKPNEQFFPIFVILFLSFSLGNSTNITIKAPGYKRMLYKNDIK